MLRHLDIFTRDPLQTFKENFSVGRRGAISVARLVPYLKIRFQVFMRVEARDIGNGVGEEEGQGGGQSPSSPLVYLWGD